MRDRSGHDRDPVFDRQTLVHQEQRPPLHAAEATSRRGDLRIEGLFAHFDTEACCQYLELGKHARGGHKPEATASAQERLVPRGYEAVSLFTALP